MTRIASNSGNSVFSAAQIFQRLFRRRDLNSFGIHSPQAAKEFRGIFRRSGLAIVLSLMAIGAAAQSGQTVTTSTTAATNTIPYYSGSSVSPSSATLGNSPISISGSNVGIGSGMPFYVNDTNGYTVLQQLTPATNGSNGSNPHSPELWLQGNYYNATTGSQPDTWELTSNIWPGTNPVSTFIVQHSGSPGPAYINLVADALNLYASSSDGMSVTEASNATTVNLSSPSFSYLGRFVNSSGASQNDTWSWQNVLGSGSTPTSTLTLTHAGSTGSAYVSLPGILFPGSTTPQTAPWTGVLCGGDYAESVDVTGDRTRYSAGDVLVIDSDSPGKFLKSSEPYSTLVTGVYSTDPGVVGRRQKTTKNADEVPMAMIGIVPTKASAENGPIHPGDLLVTSSTLGHAMKGTNRARMLGAVIGKALGSLDSGTGVIEVAITLQ